MKLPFIPWVDSVTGEESSNLIIIKPDIVIPRNLQQQWQWWWLVGYVFGVHFNHHNDSFIPHVLYHILLAIYRYNNKWYIFLLIILLITFVIHLNIIKFLHSCRNSYENSSHFCFGTVAPHCGWCLGNEVMCRKGRDIIEKAPLSNRVNRVTEKLQATFAE